jgi:hypothetical protein
MTFKLSFPRKREPMNTFLANLALSVVMGSGLDLLVAPE